MTGPAVVCQSTASGREHNDSTKHVVLTVECFRTRVRFSPPPPNDAEGRNRGLRHFCLERHHRRAASSTRCASSVSAPQDAWSETSGRAIGGPERQRGTRLSRRQRDSRAFRHLHQPKERRPHAGPFFFPAHSAQVHCVGRRGSNSGFAFCIHHDRIPRPRRHLHAMLVASEVIRNIPVVRAR